MISVQQSSTNHSIWEEDGVKYDGLFMLSDFDRGKLKAGAHSHKLLLKLVAGALDK